MSSEQETVADAFVNGKDVQIAPTGVGNAQTLGVQLSGVTDTLSAGDVIIPNVDGQLTNADVNQTRAPVGQPVTGAFREDVNVDG